MAFLPWHLALAYLLDLVVGDPHWLPHPTRWIGRLITRVESVFYDSHASPNLQRLAGCAFWMLVTAGVLIGTIVIMEVSRHLNVYSR